MPNSTSAKKALRQNLKRRQHNRTHRSALRTAIKKCRTAAEAGQHDQARDLFRVAVKQLDQAAAKGLVHRNTAARTKSRLSRLLKKHADGTN
ncbi:MAG: 30S ribosomal protein S20 [Maioricimonas sp. JB049]